MQTAVRSERVLRGFAKLAFGLLTPLLFAAELMFIAMVFLAGDWRGEPVQSALFTATCLLYVLNPLVRWLLLAQMKAPVKTPPAEGLRVAMVTTYVAGAEPIEMLERTLRAFAKVNYPHETWVLDESNDAAMQELCAALNVSYFSRKEYPAYQTDSGSFERATKHGNYNAWLTEIGYARYDVITGFDPDHVPGPAFLDEVLGFLSDPKVGYVQVAQAYYNQQAGLIANGAAQETYDYNSTLQMASYGFGYPIVTGCHNTHRMAALREVGGFAAHDADDLLITLLYRNKGWQGVFVPGILARGLTPVDWSGYLTQQRRWARSVLDIKFRVQGLHSSRLPFRARMMSYLHGLSYLQPAILFCSVGALLLISLYSGRVPSIVAHINPTISALMVLMLVTCFFFRQQFFLDRRTEGGFHVHARLLRIAKVPFLLLALMDVIRNRRHGYELTPKSRAQRKLLILPAFAPVAVVVICAWCLGHAANLRYPPVLTAGALAVVLGCLLLIASEWLPSPPPYDPAIPVEFNARIDVMERI
jgi:cellulose synthase (UDP-forming)